MLLPNRFLLLALLINLPTSITFLLQRPRWVMKMVPTNVKIHLGHASTKKMVKIDPNSTSAYRYKKVFGMGKVAVVGGSGQHDVLDSSKKVIDNPSSGGALESSIVVGKDQPKPEHVQLQDVQPVALAHDAPYTAIEAKQPLEKERKIEPWTWEMVRNMDDNDIQATSVDALGVTLRSFILACIGMYDISGEFLKSPEAMLTVQTDSDCVASFKDTKQNVDSAWQSARALWTVQVSDSIDKESSLSDRVAIIAGGIKEVYSDKKVRAPLAVLAQDIASNIAQVASAVIKSAGKLSLEAQRSQRLQQGLHGLRISVPLLCAICAVGALKVVEWGGVSE